MPDPSPEPWQQKPSERAKIAKVRAAALAGEWWGVVSRRQLIRLGASTSSISRWMNEGLLHPKYPGVYAWGHAHVPVEGDLAAALLYAGHGAALDAHAALFWWGIEPSLPEVIEIVSPRRVRNAGRLIAHQRRSAGRITRDRLPVVPLAEALLAVAAKPTATLHELRYLLAQADYHHRIRPQDLERSLRRGRPGATKLRQAAERHQPLLAQTRSVAERCFFELVEEAGLPLPEVNVRISRMTVDFLWREQRLVVEIDGARGHSSPAQRDRDHRRDVRLRALDLRVTRYSASLLFELPQVVIADLSQALHR